VRAKRLMLGESAIPRMIKGVFFFVGIVMGDGNAKETIAGEGCCRGRGIGWSSAGNVHECDLPEPEAPHDGDELASRFQKLTPRRTGTMSCPCGRTYGC